MSDQESALELHRRLGGKIHVAENIELTEGGLTKLYTPGVAEVSRELTKHPERVKELSVAGKTVAVISDGSAVLGLGNVGPVAALPVMEGKAYLFRALAEVNAWPIVLNTQDVDEVVAAVKAIAPSFGGVNLEDIAAPACFEIERRLRAELSIPVVHDDQHATAIVVLAGLYNGLKLVGKDLAEIRIVINGAGAAGSGITRLLRAAGAEHITILDSRGALSVDRTDIAGEKLELARLTKVSGVQTLNDAVKAADVLIGVSAGGLFTPEHVQSMAPNAIVFALANPEPEILPEAARNAGARIVATGRSDYPNQINNVLVFPGMFQGMFEAGARQLTDQHKLAAARTLADLVTNLDDESIIPSIFDQRVVPAIIQALVNATI